MNKLQKKALVPELRFPEFEDASDWEYKPLSKVCEVNPSSEVLPASFVYIDLESVKSGALLQKKIIERDGAPSRAQRLLNSEDIIFQMVRPYQKNNYFFKPDDNMQYVASTGYAQLRANESKMYLYQCLSNDRFVERVLAQCTGSNYPAINSNDLSKIKVEIPKGKEQQKIADCLSSLDELITANTQKHELLQSYKKGLLQNLFPAEGETVPALRFPGFQGAEEWEYRSVQKLIDEKIIVSHLDGNHGSLYPRSEEFSKEGVPYITAKDFVSGEVNFSRCKHLPMERAIQFKKGVAKNGDILFAHNATVGPVAKLNMNLKFVILSTTATYFRCDNKILINDFLKYALSSPNFINQYTRVMSQSTRNQVPITTQRTFNLQFPLFDEQHKIADCLSSVDDLITAQAQKIEELKVHKKGLMQQLFPSVNEVSA